MAFSAERIRAINAKELFRQSLMANKEYLAELNRSQLKDKGIRSDNQKLPGYSDPYKVKRSKAGKQTGFKDLYFGGDFNKGIVSNPFAEFIEFSSTDWKADILGDNWGNEIYGLTDANWGKAFDERIIPTFNQLFLNAFLGS